MSTQDNIPAILAATEGHTPEEIEIIRLQAELATTAEMARGLREGYQNIAQRYIPMNSDLGISAIMATCDVALNAEPTAAERQARENASKARALDQIADLIGTVTDLWEQSVEDVDPYLDALEAVAAIVTPTPEETKGGKA